MEYYQVASDSYNYSNSFKMWRQEWISKYALVVPVVVIAFCVILAKYFGWAKKNKQSCNNEKGKEVV